VTPGWPPQDEPLDDQTADAFRDACGLIQATINHDRAGLDAILAGMTEAGARNAASSLAGIASGLIKMHYADPDGQLAILRANLGV
jgi:hypothetical protein